MGIVLRQSEPEFAIVETYYDLAKREPTRRGNLEIGHTDAFKSNFLDLVRMLDAKQQSHVVVVAHGTAAGLLMPITDKTSDAADNAVLKDLVVLVDQWPQLDDEMVGKFASGYNTPEDQVRELVRLCHKVRSHESNCLAVHVRGCKIGKKVENLQTIKQLFNSIVVSGARCPMLYANFHPVWSRPQDQDIAAWTTKNKPATRRREFTDRAAGRRTLVLDADYNGAKASTQGVIEHADDLAKWATVFLGNTNHGVGRSLPICAMWPDSGYALAHEKEYVDEINAVRD